MRNEMSELARKVYESLTLIPKGKVVTYGELARAVRDKNCARAVGNILHANPLPDMYPCYKVVNSKGHLAANFGLGIEEQKRRLEADGIVVEDYAVDLEKYLWMFPAS